MKLSWRRDQKDMTKKKARKAFPIGSSVTSSAPLDKSRSRGAGVVVQHDTCHHRQQRWATCYVQFTDGVEAHERWTGWLTKVVA